MDDLRTSRTWVLNLRAGILAAVEDADDDDLVRLRLVVIHDMLLSRNAAATGKKIVPRSTSLVGVRGGV